MPLRIQNMSKKCFTKILSVENTINQAVGNNVLVYLIVLMFISYNYYICAIRRMPVDSGFKKHRFNNSI